MLGNESSLLSNYSISTEIKRLNDMNSPEQFEKVYNFHRGNCCQSDKTLFTHPELFSKDGKNSGKSQMWLCNACGKSTSIPNKENNYTHGLKVEGVTVDVIDEVISKKGVRGLLHVKKINSETYYNRMNSFYEDCIMFLDRHETKQLKDKTFKNLWISTDK